MAKASSYKIFTLEEVLESTGLNTWGKTIGWVDYGVFYDSVTGQMITDGTGDVGHVDAPIGDLYIDQNRLIKLVDTSVFPHVVIGEVDLAGGIAWVKITKSYTDFSAAALTKTISLYTLPAKGVLRNTFVRHSSNFTGAGITGCDISTGVTGKLSRFSLGFDVFQSVGDQIFGQYVYGCVEDYTNSTDVKATATSFGANLDQLVQGVVEIQVFFDILS